MKCKSGVKNCEGSNGKLGSIICVDCYTYKKPRKRCRCMGYSTKEFNDRCRVRTTKDNQVCSECEDAPYKCTNIKLAKKGT